MPCQETIADAKASFVTAVSEGVQKLEKECGFSRERATSALLRELNRAGDTPRATDEEIFAAMQRHNLGIEQATKTVVVSKAMRKAMECAENPSQAIDVLTKKISIHNLIYESSTDEEAASEDEYSMRLRVPIEPTIQLDCPTSSQSLDALSGRKHKRSGKSSRRKGVKSSAGSSSSSSSSRKRSVDEIGSSSGSLNKKNPTTIATRERVDSVTEEVDAKLAKQQLTASDDASSRPSSSNGRPKRGLSRSEESDAAVVPTIPHKRLRGGNGV